MTVQYINIIPTAEISPSMCSWFWRAPLKRTLTIKRIQQETAAHYGLSQMSMTSAKRHRHVSRPRQVAMYLAREMFSTIMGNHKVYGKSLPDIGKRFGGRDHTTVLHAVRQISLRLSVDDNLASDIEAIKARLAA